MRSSVLLIAFLFTDAFAFAQSSIKITDDLKKEFIDIHNQWRADVGTNPLTWSDEIAQFSEKWAMDLGKSCKMQHRPQDGKWAQQYGENIYWISNKTGTPTKAVNAWGSEIQYYKKPKPIDAKNYAKYGHYTQLVWKNTTKVGCAIVHCKGNGTIIVCNYDPPGNWIGETAYD